MTELDADIDKPHAHTRPQERPGSDVRLVDVCIHFRHVMLLRVQWPALWPPST